MAVGPTSVAYRLSTEARVYGGNVLTTSDVAVAAGLATFGDASLVRAGGAHAIAPDVLIRAQAAIQDIVATAIEAARPTRAPVVVVLVGGGAVLVPTDAKLHGVERLVVPPHASVANAVGACIAQVSGTVDHIVPGTDTESAKRQACADATAAAVKAGAAADGVTIVDVDVIPLAYIPGGALRVRARAVGDLDFDRLARGEHLSAEEGSAGAASDPLQPSPALSATTPTTPHATPTTAAPPRALDFGPELAAARDRFAGRGWRLTEEDVECMSIGSGILGSGGGGSCLLARLRLLAALREGLEVRIITPADVPEEGVVLPLAMMGAPSVLREQLPSDTELAAAAAAVAAVVSQNGQEVRWVE